MSSSFTTSIDEASYTSQFFEENVYQLSIKFLKLNLKSILEVQKKALYTTLQVKFKKYLL